MRPSAGKMDLIAAIIGLVFASATATLFARNLTLYRPAPLAKRTHEASSVLIPARNEERNIGPAVRSILESTAAPIEVIVLDDARRTKQRKLFARLPSLIAASALKPPRLFRRAGVENSTLATCPPDSPPIRFSSFWMQT